MSDAPERVEWWPLSVYLVAAVLLVDRIGWWGFFGVSLVAVAYHGALHEYFKHRGGHNR